MTLPSRHLALDGLRGIAALGVAIMHVYYAQTFWVLWSMVDLFFVLSGFLVGSLLLDDRINIGNFLARRALRIWPVYYLSLAIAVVVSYARIVGNPSIEEPSGVLPSVFFVQFVDLYGLTDVQAQGQIQNYLLWFKHSWTIAVEQQFYVLLPLVLVLFHPSARHVFFGSLMAVAGVVLLRSSGQGIAVLASRADGLLLGVALAALFSARQGALPGGRSLPRLLWPFLGLAGAALVVPYVASGYLGRIPEGSLPTNPFTVLGFCTMYFALVGWLITQPRSMLSGLLGSTVPVYLGGVSYAVYMFHPLIQGFVGMYDRSVPLAELPWPLQVAMWLLILGCSHLSKVVVENRFNALKSRFPLYREATPSVASN
jgi:peptidoglycan/LPS O-acetylase OafA/YrhL